MRVATDIGGTFTDLVYIDNDGKIGTEKDHTTPWGFEEGIINVIEKSNIDPKQIEMFVHGSTVVINTLTERKGVKVGLITTKGMRDVLEIARGNRPNLYNFKYQKPAPFVERHLRLEVQERLNYKGKVLEPLNEEDLRKAIDYFKNNEVKAIAICFLHSYINPVHEKKAIEFIKNNWPEVFVTGSHEISKEWREYERTNTAVFNSYVKPIVHDYINKLNSELEKKNVGGTKYIMQSNGGATTFEFIKEQPIQMIESGPVAGVFGAAVLGNLIGEKNIIAFDVGGTTAKCSLISDSEVKITTDYYIERSEINAGYPVKAPVVDIVEIGNGGGSMAWIDHLGSLQVGPQSAGSNPGPIAYGLGGTEPTTTDAHLITGRLSAKNFDYEVDMKKVEKILDEKIAKPLNVSTEDSALGIIQIANSNMLNALKLISVRKGYDPSDFVMVAYGGGGAMHAAALAREIGVKKVIIPVSSAVFSAWGMLQTDLRRDYIETLIASFNDIDLQTINNKWREMEEISTNDFMNKDTGSSSVVFMRYLDMRYVGQEHTVKVPVPNGEWNEETRMEIINSFHQLHEQNYSFKLLDTKTEIVNFHLTCLGKVDKVQLPELQMNENVNPLIETRKVYFDDIGWVDTDIYSRKLLNPGTEILGPMIIEEKQTSTLVYPDQVVKVDKYGNLIIEKGEN